MQVVVRIHESKTDKLKLGQRVAIQVEGLPGREFSGTVSKIAAVADSQNRWLNPDLKEYETEITLDETDAPLKPGVTAHAEILVERVDQKLAVPVQAVYSKAGQRYVFASKGGNTRPVKVELGAIGTEWAEIQAGLNGGEQVLLAFSDEQKRLIPDDRSFGSPNSRTPGSKSAATQKRRGGRRPSSPGSAVKSAAGHSRPAHSGSTGAQGHAGS